MGGGSNYLLGLLETHGVVILCKPSNIVYLRAIANPHVGLGQYAVDNVSGNGRRAVMVAAVFVGFRLAQALFLLGKGGYISKLSGFGLVLKICSLPMFVFWVFRENGRRKKKISESGISEEERPSLCKIAEEEGMSDLENIHFRYCC